MIFIYIYDMLINFMCVYVILSTYHKIINSMLLSMLFILSMYVILLVGIIDMLS